MTDTLKQIGDAPGDASVTSPYTPVGKGQISEDGRTAYATVAFRREVADARIDHVKDLATEPRSIAERLFVTPGHRQDARRPRDDQTGRPRPGPAGRHRLRDRPGARRRSATLTRTGPARVARTGGELRACTAARQASERAGSRQPGRGKWQV